jgi:hypothetical protein
VRTRQLTQTMTPHQEPEPTSPRLRPDGTVFPPVTPDPPPPPGYVDPLTEGSPLNEPTEPERQGR